jgi:hypothetical protein
MAADIPWAGDVSNRIVLSERLAVVEEELQWLIRMEVEDAERSA